VERVKPAPESDPETEKNNELLPPVDHGEHEKESFHKRFPSGATKEKPCK
jgi:hypothetical protein